MEFCTRCESATHGTCCSLVKAKAWPECCAPNGSSWHEHPATCAGRCDRDKHTADTIEAARAALGAEHVARSLQGLTEHDNDEGIVTRSECPRCWE